jgi:hypothetical protein
MDKHDVLMVLLGSLTPFAVVFTIRAVKLIPAGIKLAALFTVKVVRDVLSALVSLVKNKVIQA